MFENFSELESRDLWAAALASVVACSECSSLTPSITCADRAHQKSTPTKVKEWQGQDVFEAINTCQPECKSPYVEDASSIKTWEIIANWETRAPMPSLMRGPELVKVKRAFPPNEDTPELSRNETMELITRVRAPTEEDTDLSALRPANKTILGLADL